MDACADRSASHGRCAAGCRPDESCAARASDDDVVDPLGERLSRAFQATDFDDNAYRSPCHGKSANAAKNHVLEMLRSLAIRSARIAGR